KRPTKAPTRNRLRQCAQRRVNNPSSGGRSWFDKQRYEHQYTGDEENPVRKHVHKARRHVARTNLQRNQEVGKRTTKSCSEDEEHHDSAMHRHQREIKLGIKFPLRVYPASEQGSQPFQIGIRKRQLYTEQNGEKTT